MEKQTRRILAMSAVLIGFIILSVVLICVTPSSVQEEVSTAVIESVKATEAEPKAPGFEILDLPHIDGSAFFSDVLYRCPTCPPKTFQRMLAIQMPTLQIITASNSYMTDKTCWYNYDYERAYGVYSGMLNTYNTLIQNVTPNVHIENDVLMVSNSFSGTNSGHDLGTLMSILLSAKQMHGDVQVAVQEHAFPFPRILEILELFYERSAWLVLEFNTTYHFACVAFQEMDINFVITCHLHEDGVQLIQEIKTKSYFRCAQEGLSVPKGAKVILIKQIHQTSARTHDAFYGQKFLYFMEMEGWVIINPEFDDMRYIICLLSQASRIVVSYGAIMWTHMLFFNADAHVVHLQVGGEVAYAPVLGMKNFHQIQMSSTDLDSDVNQDLYDKIEEICTQ